MANQSGQALKMGYLCKCAKESARNWRKRWFILNGNTLSYYADQKSAQQKGDLLLVADSIVEDEIVEEFQFAFRVRTPFESLLLAARTAEDRDAWKGMITAAVEYSQYSLRGYMLKRTKGLLASTVRKFFVLHGGVLSYHQDHEHTAATQFAMKVNAETLFEFNDAKLKLFISEKNKKGDQLIIQFEKRQETDYITWRETIASNIKKFAEAAKDDDVASEQAVKDSIMTSPLGYRPAKGGDVWPLFNTALTKKEFIVLDKVGAIITGNQKISERYLLNPDCSVRETKIKEFAFELVTAKKIVHVCATSKGDMDEWIRKIKQVISDSEIDRSDALLRAALEKIPLDYFYEVTFEEYKPLGIVLEKAVEWAMVKRANFAESGVKNGSALHAINKQVVMFDKYDVIMMTLRGWLTGDLKPPLSFVFRMAPEKDGFLMKKSTVANVPTWKARYCVLGEGKFTLYETDDPNAKVRGEIPLHGAAVSLCLTQETGKYFCFRILVGVYELVLQAADPKDMIDWGATIYHAIAIANGGGHIIAYERARIKAEDEKRKALLNQKIEQENKYIVEMISKAIEENDRKGLASSLAKAEQLGVIGELIDYAGERLREMEQEELENEQHEEQFAELASHDQSEVPEDFNDPMDAASGDASDFGHRGGPDEEINPNSATLTKGNMRRISITQQQQAMGHTLQQGAKINKRGQTQQQQEDDDDDLQMMMMASGADGTSAYVSEESMYSSGGDASLAFVTPATKEEIGKLFDFFVRSGESSINVMKFSTIYRVVTGEKGNLYKEMQLFSKFDADKSGILERAEFVAGWTVYADETQDETILKKIKQIVSGENMVM